MFDQISKEEQGQALLEMAVILPIFLLLLLGVIEIARVGYAYVTVNNAARAGARLASVGGNDVEITNAIYNAAPSLDKTSLAIRISPEDYLRKSGQSIIVEVKYPVQLVMPVIEAVMPNPVNVGSTLSMRLE